MTPGLGWKKGWMTKICSLWLLLLLCFPQIPDAREKDPEARMDATLSAAQKAQEKVEAFLQEEERQRQAIRALEAEVEALIYENHMLEKSMARQQERLLALEGEGEEAAGLARLVEALLGDLLTFLEKRMEGLVPFRLEERKGRLQTLRSALEDGEMDTQSRFRRALEVVEAELNLGLFPDAAAATVAVEGELLHGTLLHLGAAGLFFLSPDKALVARWSGERGLFLPLDATAARSVERAFAMVERRVPAGLIWLTLPEVP